MEQRIFRSGMLEHGEWMAYTSGGDGYAVLLAGLWAWSPRGICQLSR